MPYDKRGIQFNKGRQAPLMGYQPYKPEISAPFVVIDKPKVKPKKKREKPKKTTSRLVPQKNKQIMTWSFSDGTRPSREFQEKVYNYSLTRMLK